MSDTQTFIVNYTTIKSIPVTIPVNAGIYDIIYAFANAYVEHTTSNAIVSDETLVSSFGASQWREALKIGLLERYKGDVIIEETIEDFCANDDIWESAVLSAKYGRREYAIKINGLAIVETLEELFPNIFE